MNNLISKYSKYDTHFQRTDPWKHTPFYEKRKDVVEAVFVTACFIGCVVIGSVLLVMFR